MATEGTVAPRTVRVAAIAFGATLAAVTPFTATLVGGGFSLADPSVLSALLAVPFIVMAWHWAATNPRLAGHTLIGGMAATAWLFTYNIQGSGYLVGNYAYLVVIVVAAAFLVSARMTAAYAVANIIVIMLVWSTTGLAVSDLILSLAYQVLFSVLLIFLAGHLESAREEAVGLARQVQDAKRATDQVLASTWDAIIVLKDGRYDEANRQAVEWIRTWFDQDIPIGAPFRTDEKVAPGLARLVSTAHALGESDTEIPMETPKGLRTLQLRFVTRGLEGRKAFFFRDVTEERERQELQKERIRQEAELAAVRAQRDWQRSFMNMASHELRTPLTPIRLQMAMVRDPEDPALVVIERNLRRLGDLIDEILDVVRFESDQFQLDFGEHDLADLVRQQLESWEPLAKEKGLRIEADLAPAIAKADAGRVVQIIDNLLENAIKYTHEGHVKITTRADASATLIIEDTGSGFRPQDAERLFESFARMDHHLELEGTGLGLAIAQRLAQAQQGGLVAESTGIDQGATFRLRLPLART